MIQQMKTNRSLKSIRSHFNPKHSNSPTLSSNYSEKGLWSKSYKNQPIPKELKRIYIGHKFKFSDFSDEEEDNSEVVVEEEEIQILEKKKMIPHVTIMSDRGEFLSSRNRIRTCHKLRKRSERCRSVESLKLAKVVEEKREEDEQQKPERSKLSQFKDRNEFNQRNSRHEDSNSIVEECLLDSHEPSLLSSRLPEQIIEIEAEEFKEEILKTDREMVEEEYDNLIVDEIDDRKWKKDDMQSQQIEQIIEEDVLENETDNVNTLRLSLGRFQKETLFLNNMKEEQFFMGPSSSSRHSDHSESSAHSRRLSKQSEHQKVINEERDCA